MFGVVADQHPVDSPAPLWFSDEARHAADLV